MEGICPVFKLFLPQSTQLMEGICPVFQSIFAANYSTHGGNLSCFSNYFRRKVLNSWRDFILFFQIIFAAKYSAHRGNLPFSKIISPQTTQLMEGICPFLNFFATKNSTHRGNLSFLKIFATKNSTHRGNLSCFSNYFRRKLLNSSRDFVFFFKCDPPPRNESKCAN